MPSTFAPILIALGLAAGVAGPILLLTSLLGPRLRTRKKLEIYESGVPLVDASHKRMSIQFFVIAMIFILFDVEIAFDYPWALIFRGGGAGLLAAVLGVLGVGSRSATRTSGRKGRWTGERALQRRGGRRAATISSRGAGANREDSLA